ncbi:DUF397 domain-containing protein [Streptomyces sp. NPDC048275]|uniref:DUF397 domain-containing protein n=1 Tax=Streptomyces sp. NPDC048275 TaxID=3155629 RepID=UPI0033F84F10
MRWRKSSYSDQGGGNCVEIADLAGMAGVRDSKVEAGPAFLVLRRTALMPWRVGRRYGSR